MRGETILAAERNWWSRVLGGREWGIRILAFPFALGFAFVVKLGFAGTIEARHHGFASSGFSTDGALMLGCLRF